MGVRADAIAESPQSWGRGRPLTRELVLTKSYPHISRWLPPIGPFSLPRASSLTGVRAREARARLLTTQTRAVGHAFLKTASQTPKVFSTSQTAMLDPPGQTVSAAWHQTLLLLSSIMGSEWSKQASMVHKI